MDIQLKPGKVAQFLLILSLGFILAGIAGQLVKTRQGTFWLFSSDSNQELAILRFYSAVMLLLCSGLLFIIAVAKKGDNNNGFLYWLVLAIIFTFLAITKATALHESLAAPIRSALNTSKIQFYAWAYGIVVVIFPALYLKFLLSLPRRTMLLLILGGAIFILGAFGLDLIVAYLGKSIDHRTMAYIGLAALEDTLEAGGIIIIVYELLSYMGSELKWIGVRIVE
jgi:hypothetical protein